MSTDSVTIECAVQNDSRLLVGLGVIFSHSGAHGGLSEHSRQEFAAAALDTCREVFALARRGGNPDSAIQIVIGRFADRIEVAMEYPGDPIAAGSDFPQGDTSGRTGRGGDAQGSKAIDFLKAESHEGRACVKLIKYAGVAKTK